MLLNEATEMSSTNKIVIVGKVYYDHELHGLQLENCKTKLLKGMQYSE